MSIQQGKNLSTATDWEGGRRRLFLFIHREKDKKTRRTTRQRNVKKCRVLFSAVHAYSCDNWKTLHGMIYLRELVLAELTLET